MTSVKAEIIKRNLDEFPNTPSLTLAKTIYGQDIYGVFKNIEQVRSIIRYYRGQSGKRLKNDLADKTHLKESGSRAPFDPLPEGLKYYTDWTPVQVTADQLLILADLHVPYHDRRALQLALNYGLKEQVTGIIINGDGCDFYQASTFEKDPRRRALVNELKTLREILNVIRQMFPEAEIIYKIGNHEERWQRYLKIKAPAFMDLFDDEDLPLLSYESIFDAKKYNIKVVADKRLIKAGHLNIVHGHEFWRGMINPVNPARGLFLKGKENALGAHLHQTSHHTEPTLSGEILSCWTIGCLCDLHPDYSPFNKWNHGFAIVHRDGDDFEVLNKTIIEGKIY